jgi:hypothetical protein
LQIGSGFQIVQIADWCRISDCSQIADRIPSILKVTLKSKI